MTAHIYKARRPYTCTYCKQTIIPHESYYNGGYYKAHKDCKPNTYGAPLRMNRNSIEFLLLISEKPLFVDEIPSHFNYRDLYKKLRKLGFKIHTYRYRVGTGVKRRSGTKNITILYLEGQEHQIIERIKSRYGSVPHRIYGALNLKYERPKPSYKPTHTNMDVK